MVRLGLALWLLLSLALASAAWAGAVPPPGPIPGADCGAGAAITGYPYYGAPLNSSGHCGTPVASGTVNLSTVGQLGEYSGTATITGITPGGDVSFSSPNFTVTGINGNPLGSTTPTAGNLLIGQGSNWLTEAITGDITLTSAGVATIGAGKVTSAKMASGAAAANVGSLSGDLSGTLPSPTVAKIQGTSTCSTSPTTSQLMGYNGTCWGPVTAPVSGINQLTGDVIAGPGTGSQASSIASGAVTYAKIQNEAANTLLGNPTGSPAPPSEITLGSGLSFSGGSLVSSGGGGSGTVGNCSTAGLIAYYATTGTAVTCLTTSVVAGAPLVYGGSGSAPFFSLNPTVSGLISSGTGHTLSLPTTSGNDTLTSNAATQTLTNKTLTSPTINGGTFGAGAWTVTSGTPATYLGLTSGGAIVSTLFSTPAANYLENLSNAAIVYCYGSVTVGGAPGYGTCPGSGGFSFTAQVGLGNSPTVYNSTGQTISNGSSLYLQSGIYKGISVTCTVNSTCATTNDAGYALTANAPSVTFTLVAPSSATTGQLFGSDGTDPYSLTTPSGNIYGCGPSGSTVSNIYEPLQVIPDGTNWMCVGAGNVSTPGFSVSSMPVANAWGNLINSSFTDNGTTAATTEPFSALVAETVANYNNTGSPAPTILNGLVKLATLINTSYGTATTTSDNLGAFGICLSGCTNTGSAVIAVSGPTQCNFDGPTTAGDPFGISNVTNNPSAAVGSDCHDLTASPASGQQILGWVTTTNSGSGLYSVLLSPYAQAAGSSGGGGGSIGLGPGLASVPGTQNTGSQTVSGGGKIYLQQFPVNITSSCTYDTNCNGGSTNDTGAAYIITAASVTITMPSPSSIGSNSVGAVFYYSGNAYALSASSGLFNGTCGNGTNSLTGINYDIQLTADPTGTNWLCHPSVNPSGGGVTFPTSGSAVVSAGPSSNPNGVAPGSNGNVFAVSGGAWASLSQSAQLDAVFGTTQGILAFRGPSGWQALTPPTSAGTYTLNIVGGSGHSPFWNASGGGIIDCSGILSFTGAACPAYQAAGYSAGG